MSKDNRNERLVFSKMLPKWRSGVWGWGDTGTVVEGNRYSGGRWGTGMIYAGKSL